MLQHPLYFASIHRRIRFRPPPSFYLMSRHPCHGHEVDEISVDQGIREVQLQAKQSVEPAHAIKLETNPGYKATHILPNVEVTPANIATTREYLSGVQRI